MSVIRQCECCSGDGSEGKEWFIGAEGEDICARCAAELLGAERDALHQQLQGAVDRAEKAEADVALLHEICRINGWPEFSGGR